MNRDRLDERLEFRPDSSGEFDEIVARFADGMVHVETLSDQGCYVGFYWADGRYCQWWIGCTGRGRLTYSHEDGKDDRQALSAPPSRATDDKGEVTMPGLSHTQGGARDEK